MATMTLATDRASRRVHSAALPWLVLALGIPASFFLFTLVQNSVADIARLRFEREAKDANSIIEGRLRSYSDVLYALRALFASEDPVDRLRFHRFVESLDLKSRYPGFDALNYAAHVPARDKRRFEEVVRRDTSLNPRGYPQFAIKPPGERPEYYVVVYMEPIVGYESSLGVDIGVSPMAANPEKVGETIHLQRDTGKLIASGQPLRIKSPRKVSSKESVFLGMRLPVYRKGMPVETVEQRRAAYIGSAGAGFNVEHLMREALNE